jgi:hypothetical protein
VWEQAQPSQGDQAGARQPRHGGGGGGGRRPAGARRRDPKLLWVNVPGPLVHAHRQDILKRQCPSIFTI